MLDWLDAIPNLGVAGVAGVAPQKSASSADVSGVAQGVRGVERHLDRTPATPAATPLNIIEPQKSAHRHLGHLGHPNPDNESLSGRDCLDPAGVRASWREGLSKLDHTAPPAGISSMLWGRWLDDAEFIFNQHGWTAARLEFDELDLFGVFGADRPALGGIVDRLRGARDLQFTPDRATWSRYGVPSHFNRTGGQTLVRSGLVVLWSLAAAGAR